jgi:hypothetical protein
MAVAVTVGLAVVACGGDANSEVAATSTTEGTSSTPTRDVSNAESFYLLKTDGWELRSGATAASMPGGLPFGGQWTLSYRSQARETALGLYDPDEDARALAEKSHGQSPIRDVKINGVDGVAFQEQGKSGAVGTHVMWDTGSYIVWLTAYDAGIDEAVALAQNVEPATESEWKASVAAAGG